MHLQRTKCQTSNQDDREARCSQNVTPWHCTLQFNCGPDDRLQQNVNLWVLKYLSSNKQREKLKKCRLSFTLPLSSFFLFCFTKLMPCVPFSLGLPVHTCINLQLPFRPVYYWTIKRRLSRGIRFQDRFSWKIYNKESRRKAKDSLLPDHLSESCFVILINKDNGKFFHFCVRRCMCVVHW